MRFDEALLIYPEAMAEPGLNASLEGFIDPQVIFVENGEGFGFNPKRDYLYPLQMNELILNQNFNQNPNWEEE